MDNKAKTSKPWTENYFNGIGKRGYSPVGPPPNMNEYPTFV